MEKSDYISSAMDNNQANHCIPSTSCDPIHCNKDEMEKYDDGGWSKDQILLLIKAVTMRPVLYDSTAPEYNDSHCRKVMMHRVAKEVSSLRPTTTLIDVMKMWDKLITDYEIENRRIMFERRRSGRKAYESTLYYYNALAFLEKVNRKRRSQVKKRKVRSARLEITKMCNGSEVPCEESFSVYSDEKNIGISSLINKDVEAENCESPNCCSEKHPMEAYGDYVGCQLKLVPEEEQLNAQYTINEILYHALNKQKTCCVKI